MEVPERRLAALVTAQSANRLVEAMVQGSLRSLYIEYVLRVQYRPCSEGNGWWGAKMGTLEVQEAQRRLVSGPR